MILYQIPGRNDIEIENVVFDYNGSIVENIKIHMSIAPCAVNV